MPLSTTILLLMSLLSLFGCGQNEPAPGPGVPLKSIRYSGTRGYHAHSNVGFRAQRQDDGTTRVALEVGNDRDRVFLYGPEVMDHIDSLVAEYKMYKFKGHYDPKFEILDGDSWSLSLDFADGTWSSCGGYMAYPPGKGAEAIGHLEGLLNEWLNRGPAEDALLTFYRFEMHTDDEDAVYCLTRQDDATLALSWRKRGMAKEETLPDAAEYLAKRLCDIMRWNQMYTYTGEDVASEDTSRPRWKVSIAFADGWHFETMDYLDRKPGDEESWRQDVPSFSEVNLMHEASSVFDSEITRLKTEGDGR